MLGWIITLWTLVWLAPNTQQIMISFDPVLESVTPIKWRSWQRNKLSLAIWQIFDRYRMTFEDMNKEKNILNVDLLNKIDFTFEWKPCLAWLLGMATLAGYALVKIDSHSEFLYFQF